MIGIRADANPYLGLGHVMRCLSIANALSALGYKIVFLLASKEAEKIISDKGYETLIFNSDYRNLEEELDCWPGITFECILVDSYYVTPSFFRFLKARTDLLVYLDDLATFSYPVDVLINYNVYGSCLNYDKLYHNSGVRMPRLLIGPSYVPLRSEFRGVHRRVQPEIVKNVLISTGGSDAEHVALSLINAKPQNYTYHFLIGAMNNDKAEIEKLASSQEEIVLHENVVDMKSLLIGMDLVVSAAGSTLYEICACRVPLITYILADNQAPGAAEFEHLGLAVNIGDIRKIDDPVRMILSTIVNLSNDYERRVAAGNRMAKIVDGLGAERIAEIIQGML